MLIICQYLIEVSLSAPKTVTENHQVNSLQ